MVLEVGVLAEAAITDMAFERPRPIVDVHMRLEVPWRRERLRTESALVWLLLQTKKYAIYIPRPL